MKTFWSLLAKILLVIVIVQGWFLYSYYHKNEQLVAENLQLEKELLLTKDELLLAEQKAEELEKRSLEGMLKETNKAVVSGWEKLLDAVEEELNKARESIGGIGEEKSSEEDANKDSVDQAELESDNPSQPPKSDTAKDGEQGEETSPQQTLPQQTVPQEKSEDNSVPSLPPVENPIKGERT